MKSTDSIEAYRAMFCHIVEMHNNVEHSRMLNNGYLSNRARRKQYPAATVACEYKGRVAVGNHHDSSSREDFNSEVYDALISKFGDLNVHTSECDNLSGHCAENYAASGVINQGLRGVLLSDLSFTDAVQPRTGKGRDWCGNCHKMFD